jgi:NNP family nitrate/nitrite transporter-like MFS transporter
MGYSITMFLSGFVSSRITHRKTILLSALISGLSFFVISSSSTLVGIKIGLVTLGIGCGFYFPSGIATITSLIEAKKLGKALGLHELGPNLAYVLAPVIVEFFLDFTSWRIILMVLGSANLLMAVVFGCFGQGGHFPGEAPHLRNLRKMLSQSSFWIIIIFFSLAAAGTIGVYSIIPTYLVVEKGMEQATANTLFSLSRISVLFVILLAGYLVDRVGTKLSIGVIMVTAGVTTILLGLTTKLGLIIIVFIQPVLISSFFPAGFAAISKIAPRRMHNLAVSVILPLSVLFGGGIVPAILGFLGEYSSFSIGFVLLGGLTMTSIAILFLLKYPEFKKE